MIPFFLSVMYSLSPSMVKYETTLWGFEVAAPSSRGIISSNHRESGGVVPMVELLFSSAMIDKILGGTSTTILKIRRLQGKIDYMVNY